MNKHTEILAKSKPSISLYDHLVHCVHATQKCAMYHNMDKNIATIGALLHDIGKASFIFRQRLNDGVHINDTPFRHEIASIFFISLFDKDIHEKLIEMILCHHKSSLNDIGRKGILDLIEDYGESKIFEYHITGFDEWVNDALDILMAICIDFKIKCDFKKISIDDARQNFKFSVDYIQANLKLKKYSEWKGLLMGADYFSSTFNNRTVGVLKNTFKNPNIGFYNRKHELYPLSLKKSSTRKKHTIVTASTGSGKTDFLLKRCKKRVFYILPYTASINAMYNRLKGELSLSNPDLDIRVLHSTSSITVKNDTLDVKMIQSLFGSSIKVLTPHQIACVVFGIKGYESILLDLKGCDIIMDEIHTYSNNIQSIVLKMIEILKYNGCRIHIGTATLPTQLYKEILNILGDSTQIVKLNKKQLKSFNRHRVFKIEKIDDIKDKINDLLNNNGKLLIVKNTVKSAQLAYTEMKTNYPEIEVLLIHSRFKRSTRNELESKLMELNKLNSPCIVISTQVIEVSIDISFDLMVADCSPIDSLLQRFGRINRVRNINTIGKYKPVYVLPPPLTDDDALPYSLDILNRTYHILPSNGSVLNECDIQKMIDYVYPSVDMLSINSHSIFVDGEFNNMFLQHNSNSMLMDKMDILSVNVILCSDVDLYLKSNIDDAIMLEIPVTFNSIRNMKLVQLDNKNKPYVIDDIFYDDVMGLNMSLLNENNKQKNKSLKIF